jgi:hypothetical protein
MVNANLHPTQQPRPTKSHAEHRVYTALQTALPAGWTAWHSLRIHDDSGAEGEGDFLLIDPDRGMPIIEVKGRRHGSARRPLVPKRQAPRPQPP